MLRFKAFYWDKYKALPLILTCIIISSRLKDTSILIIFFKEMNKILPDIIIQHIGLFPDIMERLFPCSCKQ